MVEFVGTVIVGIETPGIDAMRKSVLSLSDALPLLEVVPESLRQFLGTTFGDLRVEAVDNIVDLSGIHVVDRTADGADKVCLRCDPNDRYLELMAAIAANSGDRLCLNLEHGWPILSVVARTDTVAEAGGAGNAPGGGAA